MISSITNTIYNGFVNIFVTDQQEKQEQILEPLTCIIKLGILYLKEDGTKLGKGETLKFVVLEFSKEYRRVVVSHTSIFKEQEKRNVKVAVKKAAEAEKTTLGDIGGLADLKKKMEASNKKK